MNKLRGPIPRELGDLPNLRSLVLEENGLSGSIPPQLGNLWRLDHLSLDNNDLTGDIPAELGNLTHLASLSLCGNELSGFVPAELASQWSLGWAFVLVDNNALHGNLPNARFVSYGYITVDQPCK